VWSNFSGTKMCVLEAPMKKTKRRSRAYWARLVAEYEQSPGSKSEFAAHHNVNAGTFEWWFYRLRRERRESSLANPDVRLVEVSLPPTRVERSPETIPFAVSGRIEAVLPSGISLRFDTNVSPFYAGELLATIESGIRC
jgi:transposase-like protein